MSEPFARPLSVVERGYVAAARLYPPFAVQLVVEGEGQLDVEELRAAAAFPWTRLRRRGGSWVDSGIAPRVTVLARRPGEQWPGERWPGEGPSWDSERPPSVESAGDFGLSGAGTAGLDLDDPRLRTPLDGPEILSGPGVVVFRAPHAMMDARGVAQWAADVFRVLGGKLALGEPVAGNESLLRRELVAGRAPLARTPPVWPDPFGPVPFGPSRRGQVGFGPARIGPSRRGPVRLGSVGLGLGQLGSVGVGSVGPSGDFRWWRRTVGIDAYAVAARLAALLSDRAGTPLRVMIPVDLRRHLTGRSPDERQIAGGNLSLPLFLDVAPGAGWKTAQVTVLRALQRKAELVRYPAESLAVPDAILRAGLAGFDRVSRWRGRYCASAILSDLGRLDPRDYSAGGFGARTAYLLPTHIPLAPLSITVVRMRKRTELVASYRAGSDAERAVSAFLDAAVDELAISDGP